VIRRCSGWESHRPLHLDRYDSQICDSHRFGPSRETPLLGSFLAVMRLSDRETMAVKKKMFLSFGNYSGSNRYARGRPGWGGPLAQGRFKVGW
jgi:hypothetical protein